MDRLIDIISHGDSLMSEFPKLELEWLLHTVEVFDIQNYEYFISQCAHESSNFKTLTENLNYSETALLKLWPNRFILNLARECARNPERIANIVYANRLGNGDISSGDGWRFRGRGLIQITGKSNYRLIESEFVRCGLCESGEIIDDPDILSSGEFAYLSAGAFWSLNHLDKISDYKTLTKKINGGLNGLSDRLEKLQKVEQIFKQS